MENTKNIYNEILKNIGIIFGLIFALMIIYFGIDFALKDVLSSVARAVISNFIVFASVIIFVSESKVKPAKMIAEAQKTVVDEVLASETAKTESETKLSEAEESVSRIGNEIEVLFENTESNAKLVGAKILEDADRTVDTLKTNTNKVIENNQLILKNDLLRRASLASIEVAKAHIINELNNNQGLHDRLIDESIEAIEGVELA